jgi:toxin YoeB
MEIIFSPDTLEQLRYWKKSENAKVMEKIDQLIKEIQLTPYEGTGKPEQLKHQWSGYWPRGITWEHRLVYKVDGETILIAQLRYHY